LCALILKPHHDEAPRWWERPIRAFFGIFNYGYDAFARGYGFSPPGRAHRRDHADRYVAVIALGLNEFRRRRPVSFRSRTRGYLIVAAQLPPGASLARTNEVMLRIADIATKVPGVTHGVNIVGFSGATFSVAPNAGAIFAVLEPFDQRAGDPRRVPPRHPGRAVSGLRVRFRRRSSLWCAAAGAGHRQCRRLPHDGPGPGRARAGGAAAAVFAMMGRAARRRASSNVFSLFETSTPQLYLDIDRTKAQLLGINISDVFSTLQVLYRLDLCQRLQPVRAQLPRRCAGRRPISARTRATCWRCACAMRRAKRCRSARSRPCATLPVPIACRATIFIPRPSSMARRRPATARARRWTSCSGLAAQTLPDGFSYEWTTLAFQQHRAGNTAMFAFLLAVVFVFLVLAAQFESLTLPLSVILIVPMCLIAAITGVIIARQDNNILTQVGFIVLIALAARNAILMVEFAKKLEDGGQDTIAAAIEAAKLRLRPIVMTSMAFILGVVPLVWATGAGAELRQALGTPVFAGMIGVTFFGLIFTPARDDGS
jgi:multidrug efflux pump subunit AcrB